MRINKYLAHAGHATRRGADELIASKKVLINGRIAVLGDKAIGDAHDATTRQRGGRRTSKFG